MAVRPRLPVAVAALAGLLLAGCAEAPAREPIASPAASLARIQAVQARVTEAKSARLSMTVRTIFGGEEVAASTATTEGVYDYAAQKGQLDTTVKTAGLPFRFTERTLIIGSAVYTKLPEPPEPPEGIHPGPEDGPHKPWVKLELPTGFAGQAGFGYGFGFGGEGPGDPTQALQFLTGAASKAEAVGQEEVRGVPATRYSVTFDASKQAAQLPDELEGLLEESGITSPKPADVWIDDEGRLRKIHYALTMKVPDEMAASGAIEGPGSEMTVQTTLELYDFGVEVNVTPPPAEQVEVIGPDLPPGCTPEKGKTKGEPTSGAKQDTGQAEAQACLEFWTGFDGSTDP